MPEGEGAYALVDSSFARGQQAVWRGAMSSEMILPYIGRMDGFGFEAIDIMTPSVFEASVLELKENPFERMRVAATRATRTPLNVWTRGRYLFGDQPQADEIVSEGIGLLAEAGVGRLTAYDPLNDVASLEGTIAAADRAGIGVTGAIVYALGEAQPAKHYAALARALCDLDVAGVCLFDPAGVLHPDAAREILPGLIDALSGTPLSLASHCRSGRSELVGLEAVREGAHSLSVASPPLAGGPSLPAGGYFVENLGREGYSCAVSRDDLAEMADYVGALAESLELPAAAHGLTDQEADRHQMPLSQMHWLDAMRGACEPAEVLAEIGLIREDLGGLPMTAPVARVIARQAIENIAAGERYTRCQPAFATLVRGGMGPLDGPIDMSVGPGIVAAANDNIAGDENAAGSKGPAARVIAACLGARALEGLHLDRDYSAVPDIASPNDLLDAAARLHPTLRSLHIEKNSFSYHWNAEVAS